ncbi:glycosyltransferase [Planococcus halocryophilus]|uniref:glycosyltransferase n=1 Tax=Planococcus halocryophilus TaxID=1215089 RepID=UPI000A6ADD96|nr:glycosyltransferase [Planococcus halocryophilus]
MKKKILVFLFQLNGGGAEKTVVNILNKLDSSKFNIVLVLGNDKNNHYMDLLSENVTVKYLDCGKLRKCLLKLRKTIILEKPDLLFTTMNPNNIMLVVAEFISFRKIPVIVREANNRTQSGTVTVLNKLITKICYNYAAKVISLSHGVKEDLINNFKIKQEKIKVIYNPIDIDYINQIKNEEILDIEINGNEKTIISVGRLEEQKDFTTLIRAFNLVQSQIKSRLLILGKGSQEGSLKKLVTTLNLEEKVIFLGFKENPQKYVKNSDLFALTSKWEGFGHVIVEAMAVGTPVVVTNCNSGPLEIIKNNEYGILSNVEDYVDISNKIINLLKNDVLSAEYSCKGLLRSEDFKSDKIVKEYEEIFLETGG